MKELGTNEERKTVGRYMRMYFSILCCCLVTI